MSNPKDKYRQQKDAAKQRGIEFNLTFDEWWDIWKKSGKYEQRGCRRGQYVMSRINDTGPYEIGNIFIQTCSGNNSDAHKGRPKPKSRFTKTGHGKSWSLERRKQHSDMMKGKKQPTICCVNCNREISKNNFGRHNCRTSTLL